MYWQAFGLDRPPFRITPDTRHFFPGAERGTMLDTLVYAITAGEGILKLVGEVGSGKTMLCRMLEQRLPDSVDIVFIANPSLTAADILHAIALELGLEVGAHDSRVEVLHALQASLLKRHAKGRQVVVLVDEAQGMPIETLEQIRLLSNLETREEKLLQILLFGQPELDHRLADPAIRQLRDRIAHCFTLRPLTTDEIHAYLVFRLQAAGHGGALPFTASALRSLCRASRGYIRRLHLLADKSLLAAFTQNASRVTSRHVYQAIAEDPDHGLRQHLAAALSRLPSSHFFRAAAGTALVLLGITSYAMMPRVDPISDPLVSKTSHFQRQQDANVEFIKHYLINYPDLGQRHITSLLPEPAPATDSPSQWTAPPEGLEPARTEAWRDPLLSAVLGEKSTAGEWVRSSIAWLERCPDQHYTVQVLVTDDGDLASLEQFLRQPGVQAVREHLYVFPVVSPNGPRWRVLAGEFSSYAAAQAAARVSLAGHGNRPWARSLRLIRQEARQQGLLA